MDRAFPGKRKLPSMKILPIVAAVLGAGAAFVGAFALLGDDVSSGARLALGATAALDGATAVAMGAYSLRKHGASQLGWIGVMLGLGGAATGILRLVR